MTPNKSLHATRVGGSSSAVAVHVFRSRMPELWRSSIAFSAWKRY